MNFSGNVIMNFYSMSILMIMYRQSINLEEKETSQYKLFLKLLQITIAIFIVDIMSRCDGYTYSFFPIANHVGNFLLFIFHPIVATIWMYYVLEQVKLRDRVEKYIKLLCYAYILFHTALLIYSQFSGIFYWIDSDNIYHRGAYFGLSFTLTVFIIFLSGVICVYKINEIERKHRFTLIFFVVPPLSGAALQFVFYGSAIMLHGMVLSLLLVFLNIQKSGMYLDYLTKTNNRNKLDIYLNSKIKDVSIKGHFSAIMIDLDNFKVINDTYGHDVGDTALRELVTVLEKSLKSKDFIARFGGDEFVVVLDIANEIYLRKVVDKILSTIDRFNEVHEYPFFLGLSMGYAVHVKGEDAESFIKRIDGLMYQNKLKKRKGYKLD